MPKMNNTSQRKLEKRISRSKLDKISRLKTVQVTEFQQKPHNDTNSGQTTRKRFAKTNDEKRKENATDNEISQTLWPDPRAQTIKNKTKQCDSVRDRNVC